jgi:hypothetical protein
MRPMIAVLVVFTVAACEEHGSGGGDANPMIGDGAGGQPVGRLCTTGLAVSDPTALASPALECESRTCFHVQGQPQEMCTASCTTAVDCEVVPESPCARFECVIPISVGPFACQRMCVCATQIPPGGFPVGCD